MSGPGLVRSLIFAILVLFATFAVGVDASLGGDDWRDLYLDATPVLDVRYRFEFVDQDAAEKNAKANTVRTRVGLETGRFYGLGGGFDYEWIQHLGPEKYNDTINGKTDYPVVADPDDDQINQLYVVSENTIPNSTFKLGRQRIIWDDQRFIGNVGFRQNEQTFDSFRGIVSAIPDTTIEYVYMNSVRRAFGTRSPVGDLGLDGHGFRSQFTGFKPIAITPFALLLDYDSTSQASFDSQTYGLFLSGSTAMDEEWSLLYNGYVAYQEDYGDNPSDFDLWYYRIEPGVAYHKTNFNAGYAVLQGDGTSAFQTPLATLHKFNGLTDQFLTTPPDGLQDLYLSLETPLPGEGWLSDLTLEAGYHQFWAEKGDSHYGSEWDLGIFKKIPVEWGTFNLGLQYAAYEADNFSSDTQKLWFTVQFKFGPKPLRSYIGNGGGA